LFIRFFNALKNSGIPVSLRELLDLLALCNKNNSINSREKFYNVAKLSLVKNESNYDKFDLVFSKFLEENDEFFFSLNKKIPYEWIRKEVEKILTEDQKKQMQSMKNLEELMKQFQQRIEEQKKRHQGGSKWIGTGGTSPFGAYGYNPAGFRIGQQGSRNRKAVKVWDQRNFRDLDSDENLNNRNLSVALKKLRILTREGAEDFLNLDETINKTAKNAGQLHLEMQAERKNNIKILIFFDVGGSMDDHILICEKLFNAAKKEFKNLKYFYFHNCIYESVWEKNDRRNKERITVNSILNKYKKDYKVIVVGDAAMSPFEILYPGGSVEHYNEQPGTYWLNKLKSHFTKFAWLNPYPEEYWDHHESNRMIREIFENHMYATTVEGIGKAAKQLI